MTPGERRRRFRKAAREDGWEHLREEFPGIRQQLEQLPHPKRSYGTAWDYISWLIDNGHSGVAFTYLRSLCPT